MDVNIVCKFEFFGNFFPKYLYFSLGTVSPLLDLHSCLALNAGGAAEGHSSILHCVAVNVVPLPGLLSEQKSWDAGHDAAQQHVEDSRLAKIIGRGVCETGVAETGAAAYSAVSAAVADTLLPSSSFSHSDFDSLL